MPSNTVSDQEEKQATTVKLCSLLRGSVISFTLPAKTKENEVSLPAPLVTHPPSYAEEISIRKPTTTPSSQSAIDIAVTSPTPEAEETLILKPLTTYPTSYLKVSLGHTATTPSTLHFEGITTPKSSSTSSSQIPKNSYGYALVMPSTTRSTTHLPSLHHDAMHDIHLDLPTTQTLANRIPLSATRTTARWSEYFTPVSLPRPYSIFRKTKEILPLPVQGTRNVRWSSGDKIIELRNERSPPARRVVEKKRTCWKSVKECVGRKVEVWKLNFWWVVNNMAHCC